MWQFAINYLRSLQSYRDLSPDAETQRLVNARLRDRQNLPLESWSQLFTQPPGRPLSQALLRFLYQNLPRYSGLAIGRVRPGDRLIEDLQLPLVCWFDWPNQLCIDFYEHFHVDISDEFDESLLETVEELVYFLNQRLYPTYLEEGDDCDRTCER